MMLLSKLNQGVLLCVLLLGFTMQKPGFSQSLSGPGHRVIAGVIVSSLYPDQEWNYWIEKSETGEQFMFITTSYGSIMKLENPQDSNNARTWWFNEWLDRGNGNWSLHTRGKMVVRNDPNYGQDYIGNLYKTDYYYQGQWVNITPNLLGQNPSYQGMTLSMHKTWQR